MNLESTQIKEYIEKIGKLHPDLSITDKTVFYTRRELIDDSPYILEEKVESLSFSTSELRELISQALKEGEASRECDAKASYRHDRSDDYKGEFETYADWEKETRVRLKLEIDRGTPIFSWK